MTEFAIIRLRAANERPYYAMGLFALQPVMRRGMGTFAVDRWGRVYYDPELVQKGRWTVEQAAWVLIHELRHWLGKHHDRGKGLIEAAPCRPCAQWLANIAQDCEINDDLLEEGARLPPGVVTPNQFKLEPHKLWEQYFQELSARKNGSHQHDPPRDCGSVCDGLPRPWEEPPPLVEGAPAGIGEAEGDLLRDQVAREILSSKAYGRLPGGLLRWAQARVQPPQIAWEQELRGYFRQAVQMASGVFDYSFARPRRRGGFAGVLLPAMVRPAVEAACVLDTSGSMDAERDLAPALAEIAGIVRAMGQSALTVICCDSVAAPPQRIVRVDQIRLSGGGGTDMGAGIEAAAKHARVVVVLTDGYTPWPDQPPRGIELVIGIVCRGREEFAHIRSTAPRYARRIVHIRNAEDK